MSYQSSTILINARGNDALGWIPFISVREWMRFKLLIGFTEICTGSVWENLGKMFGKQLSGFFILIPVNLCEKSDELQ